MTLPIANYKGRGLEWLTDDMREELLENGRRWPTVKSEERSYDPVPRAYVRLYGHNGWEWLIASLDPNDPDVAYALCQPIGQSGSMSGDGKRDHDAPGVQSTRARPRLYPNGEPDARSFYICRNIPHRRSEGHPSSTQQQTPDSPAPLDTPCTMRVNGR